MAMQGTAAPLARDVQHIGNDAICASGVLESWRESDERSRCAYRTWKPRALTARQLSYAPYDDEPSTRV
jgi:hypothetical protein